MAPGVFGWENWVGHIVDDTNRMDTLDEKFTRRKRKTIGMA
jgi:hypothetical protein